MTVQVFDPTNTTLLADLSTEDDGPLDAKAQDRTNEDGSVSVTVRSGHEHASFLAPYNVLRFVSTDDTPRMAGFVSDLTDQEVDRDEYAGQVVDASADGLLALLEEAVTVPWVGVSRRPFSSDRVFNCASPPLDRSAWTAVFEQSRTYAVTQGLEYPIGWAGEDPKWIWSAADSETQPVGFSVFHDQFTLADATDCIPLISADNDFELWLDGALLYRSPVKQPGYTWWDTYKAPIRIPAGDHDVVIIAENWSTAGTANPAAVIYGLWSTDGEQLVDLLHYTDTTWTCVHDADPLPGFYPGVIAGILWFEAVGRTALGGPSTGWTLGFSATEDSNGNAWPEEIPEFVCKVGDSLRSVLRQLSETWVDVWADTEGLVLHMAAKSTGGRTQTSTVDLQPAVNITELSRTVSI